MTDIVDRIADALIEDHIALLLENERLRKNRLEITSEHAHRAAKVLEQRGWDLNDYDEKYCPTCDKRRSPYDKYCSECGTKLANRNSWLIDDLIAAIDAAVNGGDPDISRCPQGDE